MPHDEENPGTERDSLFFVPVLAIALGFANPFHQEQDLTTALFGVMPRAYLHPAGGDLLPDPYHFECPRSAGEV